MAWHCLPSTRSHVYPHPGIKNKNVFQESEKLAYPDTATSTRGIIKAVTNGNIPPSLHHRAHTRTPTHPATPAPLTQNNNNSLRFQHRRVGNSPRPLRYISHSVVSPARCPCRHGSYRCTHGAPHDTPHHRPGDGRP